jgi:hypothetical protein
MLNPNAQELNLQQTADYLESADIDHSFDAGDKFIHVGTSGEGRPFVLVNDCYGHSFVTETH